MSRYYYYLHSEREETETEEGTKFTQSEFRTFFEQIFWGKLELL